MKDGSSRLCARRLWMIRDKRRFRIPSCVLQGDNPSWWTTYFYPGVYLHLTRPASDITMEGPPACDIGDGDTLHFVLSIYYPWCWSQCFLYHNNHMYSRTWQPGSDSLLYYYHASLCPPCRVKTIDSKSKPVWGLQWSTTTAQLR